MFGKAIVRLPSLSIKEGLSSSELGEPDYNLAKIQHTEYIRALKNLGLEIVILEKSEEYPDSTFIEDIALCTRLCAIITSPAIESRRGETKNLEILLSPYFNNIERIILPGTIEAGDIMMVDNHFFIGNSNRTNNEGADQMIKILNKYGFSASTVKLKNLLHLKSGVSYLENNNMLICQELSKDENFLKFNKIIVDEEESYSANSLWINGKVLVPEGFPRTRDKIERLGYKTIALNVSEFRKLDGGLSCLSLRF